LRFKAIERQNINVTALKKYMEQKYGEKFEYSAIWQQVFAASRERYIKKPEFNEENKW